MTTVQKGEVGMRCPTEEPPPIASATCHILNHMTEGRCEHRIGSRRSSGLTSAGAVHGDNDGAVVRRARCLSAAR